MVLWNDYIFLIILFQILISSAQTPELPILIPNIVGGTTTTAEEHPYIVTILYKSGNLSCGGSILRKESPAIILTAAHCVINDGLSDHKIRLYSSDYNAVYDADTNNYIDVAIDYFIIHSDYTSPSVVSNDIALIYISDDISDIARLQTVSFENFDVCTDCCITNETLEVVGYGTDYSGGPFTQTLEHVDVDYINQDYCNNTYYKDRIEDTMICAGGNGVDSCQGDSGGPLLRKDTNQQVGIVSWGEGCAAGKPGVYTNLGCYYDWICRNMGLEGLTKTEEILYTNISVTEDQMVYYNIPYTHSQEIVDFVILITGGIGDVDLYVKFGAAPTLNDYDCRPYYEGNEEECRFSNMFNYPKDLEEGTYYVMIHGFTDSSGITLAVATEMFVYSDRDDCDSDDTTTTTTSNSHVNSDSDSDSESDSDSHEFLAGAGLIITDEKSGSENESTQAHTHYHMMISLSMRTMENMWAIVFVLLAFSGILYCFYQYHKNGIKQRSRGGTLKFVTHV